MTQSCRIGNGFIDVNNNQKSVDWYTKTPGLTLEWSDGSGTCGLRMEEALGFHMADPDENMLMFMNE